MAHHSAKDPWRQEAYILKQLKSLQAWRGSVVHQAINTFFVPQLQNRTSWNVGELTTQVSKVIAEQFSFSENKIYRSSSKSKTSLGLKFCALYEHEYGIDIPTSTLSSIQEDIRKCLENLFTNSKLREVLNDSSQYLGERSIQFKLEDITIQTQLDLVFFRSGGKLVIIDWKIAESETSDYWSQLMIYALAALSRWETVRLENLDAYEVNLLKNRINHYPVIEEKLWKTEDFIFESAEEMQAVSRDQKYNLSMLEDYEYARSEKTCLFCKFKKLCTRLEDGRPYFKSLRDY